MDLRNPNLADLFVATVAIVIGVWGVWSAWLANGRAYELPKVRWLEGQLGRGGVRCVLGVGGLLLVALGVAIAMGWKVRWSEPADRAATERPAPSGAGSA
jgi:hypothetical protein